MENQLFDLMTKMYNEMQEMKLEMKDMKTEIRAMDKKLDEKADKQDIARLEHSIDDKLSALFDAREVQIGKEMQISTDLHRVEDKVDKLEMKVIRHNFNQAK